jgi:hypothetical protein
VVKETTGNKTRTTIGKTIKEMTGNKIKTKPDSKIRTMPIKEIMMINMNLGEAVILIAFLLLNLTKRVLKASC